MKVEILMGFRHEGTQFNTGEVRVVDTDTGDYFCRAGWGKDLEGNVPTASPEKGDVVLVVQNMKLGNKVETANG